MALIAHDDVGAGAPALVFVHAFGCARSDWDAQAAYFAGQRRVVSVDLGGHGETAGRPDHASVETHGADIVALMDVLGISAAVVVGNSLGCRVALNVAERAPERTVALVLVDGSKLSPVAGGVHAALGAAAAPEAFDGVVRAMFAQMFSPTFDPVRKAALTERAAKVPPALAMALLADIGRYDLEEMERVLGDLTQPVLALQSTMIAPDGKRHALPEDGASPYLEMLRGRVADLSIETVQDCGHYPQIEYPDQTNAHLDAFLRRLSSISPT